MINDYRRKANKMCQKKKREMMKKQLETMKWMLSEYFKGGKICGPIKEGESWRIRTNKEIQDIIEGADIVKFIKISQIKMVWTY
jgi:hypothetical protein